MGILRGLIERWRCLFRRRAVERELTEEIAFHLEREAARNRRLGMSAEAAAAAARRDFGRVEQVKELHRDERGVRWILDLLGDLRFGVRGLRSQPGLTFVAVLALGLGIGGNAATFSVLDALLVRPLPFADPDQLVVLWQVRAERTDRQKMAPIDVQYFRDHVPSLRAVAGIKAPERITLLEGAEPEQAIAARVTRDFFELLGVAAGIGRTFGTNDVRGGARLAVLTHGYWQRRFAGDRAIVGRELTIDGHPTVVVGVMPVGFRLDFPSPVELWLPRVYTEAELAELNLWSENVVGRLAPGTTTAQVRSEMMAARERTYEETDRQFRADDMNPVALHEELVAGIRPAILMLLGAVALILLIACANVANLLLAHNTQRRGELALRAALGAGRGRLTRQLLAECLVLAMAGAVAAIGIGQLMLRGMLLIAPDDLPRLTEVGADWRVVLFTGAVALATTLVFGTLPALRGGRSADTRAVAGSSDRGTVGRGERTLAILVAAESALVVLLVFSAGAMLQRYGELATTETGFRADSRVAAKVVLPAARYDTPEAIAAFVETATAHLRRVPGVEAVGGAWTLPLSGRAITVGVPAVEGAPPRDTPIATGWDGVTPGYFEATGIPVVAGRAFTARDERGATPHSLIINETLARELFGFEEAVGRTLVAGGDPPTMRWRIVGVVGDTVHLGLDQPPRAQVFQPQAQVTFPWNHLELVIATSAPDPLGLAGEIRRAVALADAQQPVAEIRTLRQVAAASIRNQRFLLVMLGVFGAVALLLGAIGIYGVVGYSVARRRREMGLRLTLGARPGDIRRLVLRLGLAPVVAGLVVGALVAATGAGAVSRFLAGAQPPTLTLLAPVAALVLAAAIAAVAGPVRRAMRADPLESLRLD